MSRRDTVLHVVPDPEPAAPQEQWPIDTLGQLFEDVAYTVDVDPDAAVLRLMDLSRQYRDVPLPAGAGGVELPF